MRVSARDECRALADWLLAGPGTAEQIASSLDISENLAKRIAVALGSVLCQQGDKFRVDDEVLPVALFVVRERMGLDPVSVLEEIE